jgi:hypothetical protein
MMMTLRKILALLATVLVGAMLATPAAAQNDATQLPIGPEVEKASQAILATPIVKKALDWVAAGRRLVAHTGNCAGSPR